MGKPLHCPGKYGWLQIVDGDRARRDEALLAYDREVKELAKRRDERNGILWMCAIILAVLAAGWWLA